MRVTRRRLLKTASATVAVVGAASLVAACAPGTIGSQSSPLPPSKSPKGTLTVGLAGQSFEAMNPVKIGVTNSGAIYEALWDRLLAVDTLDGGKITPQLATAWKQIDPLTWEFALRKDVKFHNGEAFDASSAEFSLRLAMDDPKSSGYVRVAGVDKVIVVDPLTLRIVTKAPDVLTVGNVSTIQMYPKAYYTQVGEAGFTKKPVGAGPYKFDNWDDGVTVVLTKYDGYWGDKVAVDRIIFKPIPEPSTRLSALLAGEIDLAYNVNTDDAKVLQSKGFLAVAAPVGQGTGLSLVYLGAQDRNNPMSKREVRQALNYAVDKDAIVDDILLGSTRVLKGQVVGPDGFGHNPSLTPYPYDPNKAKQLLTAAGYPNGFTIDFDSAGANYAKAKEVSENVVAQLAKVGVTAKLNMLEWSNYLDKLLGAKSAPLFYVGWNYYPVMDAQFAVQHFQTSSRYKMASNTRMDDLFKQQANEFDREKRQKILHEFMATMREEAPMLFLFQSPLLYGINPRVQGFQPTADDRPRVRGLSLRD
jgi:peptide/nickel transport system substrate-binding protein